MSRTEYTLARMRKNDYDKIKRIKNDMERDVRIFTGKPNLKLHMIDVFTAIAQHNERFIQVDLTKLSTLARKRRKNG